MTYEVVLGDLEDSRLENHGVLDNCVAQMKHVHVKVQVILKVEALQKTGE